MLYQIHLTDVSSFMYKLNNLNLKIHKFITKFIDIWFSFVFSIAKLNMRRTFLFSLVCFGLFILHGNG